VFLLVWIACLAVFRIRNNTWPWTVLKASLLTLAIQAVILGLTSLGY
jgi:hypothetical protein